jgi:NADH-quinone oxidoreductase E subunit
MSADITEKLDLTEIFDRYNGSGREALIPLLQDVQEQTGFLSKDAITQISLFLKLSAAKVYGVATFYNQFRFDPIGKNHIQVCRGTACHVKGSARVLDSLERELNIKSGQTTRDGQFSLEVVSCIGACGLAPVVCVSGKVHARVDPNEIKSLLEQYQKTKTTEG